MRVILAGYKIMLKNVDKIFFKILKTCDYPLRVKTHPYIQFHKSVPLIIIVIIHFRRYNNYNNNDKCNEMAKGKHYKSEV